MNNNVGGYLLKNGLTRKAQGKYYAFDSYYDPCNEPKFGIDTLRGPYIAPRLAGMKFLGENIVPRPTDDGNGPPVSPSVMYEFIYDYLAEGPTGPCWLQWIKPEIDAAYLDGCNCIRFYWDVGTMVGDAGHMIPLRTINVGLPEETTIAAVTYKGAVTWTQFATGIQNLCEYLASKNMYLYPTATEALPVDYVTEAGLLDYIDHFMAEIIKYPNVIACDIIMEVDRCTYMQTAANCATVMNRARAARGTSTLPLTCSLSSFFPIPTATYPANLTRMIAAGIDFIDAHVYFQSSWQTLMDYLFENDIRLPVAVGEAGLAYSGVMFTGPGTVAQEITHPKSSEIRARYSQEVIAPWGRRWDLQLYTPYGVTDQWPHDSQRWGFRSDAQDGSYNFTTQRTEKTGPLATISHIPELTSNAWTLDLTGADTTPAEVSSYMIGWGQYDVPGNFTRDNHRIKRVTGTLGPGLLNEFSLQSVYQKVIVEFNAADAVASGGIITWAIGLRVGGPSAVNYYLFALTSSPGTPGTDGLGTIYSLPSSSLLGAGFLAAPTINLTHTYRMTAIASGTYPTTLTITIFDITAAATVLNVSVTDSSPNLQCKGITSLPSQVGTVYYSSMIVDAPGKRGPTFDAIPSVTNLTGTTADLSWAVTGATIARYIPQYAAMNANGFITDWTTFGALGGQTGTTVTITGLVASTRYKFRVLVIDDTLAPAA